MKRDTMKNSSTLQNYLQRSTNKYCPAVESYLRARELYQEQLLQVAKLPIRNAVRLMADDWMTDAAKRRLFKKRPSLAEALTGQCILPIVMMRDRHGESVRAVSRSRLGVAYACSLTYFLNGFLFTVADEGDWLVVSSVTMNH